MDFKLMDGVKLQKATMNWMSSASPKDRCNFIRTLIGMLVPEEIATVDNTISKRKNELKKTGRMKKKRPYHPSEPERPERETFIAPKEPGKMDAWYKVYARENCVAIDCEHVHLKNAAGIDRVKAATVSIVNVRGEEVYHAMVYHKPESFLTHDIMQGITGFGKYSLVKGRPADDVMNEVKSFLKDKFIIHWGGAIDFKSLGLDIGDFPANFDLATHFKKPSGMKNKYGEEMYQSINLQSVYFHFFGEQIQSGVHSARVDAEATMKVFVKKYKATKYNVMSSMSDENDWDQFKDIINVKKR